MKLQTIRQTKDRIFGTGEIQTSIKTSSVVIEHSVKKTYKGSKLVRVNNVVESYQAGRLDAKEQRRIERKEQRRQRRQRQEPI